ncbi:MAG: helix-turn-helix domain-containing protein [Rhodospirillales bacterium]|nr:helix-turn-helix domain-containing protein [Rhodospirillales bacterium]
MEHFLTVSECARILGVHRRTIDRAIASGALRARKGTRLVRIDPREFELFLGMQYRTISPNKHNTSKHGDRS